MHKGFFTVQRVCLMGVMIAVYFFLAKLTIPIGTLHITLASLPIVVLSMVFGPWEGAVVAVVGEFLIQALGRYGLMITTPLWCIPPMFRALVVGFGCRWLRRKYGLREAYENKIGYFLVLMQAAITTTLGNTAVLWLDSVIMNYYSFAYVFGSFILRLVTGVLTAVVTGVIAIPVVRALRQIKHRLRQNRN